MSEQPVELSGTDLIRIRDALAKAFNKAELDELVLSVFNEPLENIVDTAAPLKELLFNLVGWTNKRGVLPDFVRASYAVRTKKKPVQEIYRDFGAAPPVTLQREGAALGNAPRTATGPEFEAIVKKKLPLLDINVWSESLVRIERQVCRVERSAAPRGTGFLVGPDLVLTNYHVLQDVIENPLQAPEVAFRFDYKRLSDGTVNPGTVVKLASDWVVDASRYSKGEADGSPDRELPTADELDFILLRLEEPIGAATASAVRRGWINLPAAQPPLTSGLSIMIVQHPRGDPMKLAFDTDANFGSNKNGTRVRYSTNTDHGSSGSPCFDGNWTLLALHHMGDPAWLNPSFNEGIPISLIRNRSAVSAALAKS
ncbi:MULTISPECIES: trypsin-like peptidase domain-containing protein [unclassified Bradyrhizobium]|uniref:trypsin-like peptidase domain-containing protein n=1 Tax=unclassified Bradyrhizobium TaxID=2631580 RepID=UPI001FF7F015|nr:MULTISPECIES: trypsin-like peptidase domain-containing protein [unclassified Bradyrhizobium]MCK1319607.1 trypsin-like peptidase domain-containing protein [Bradyrhizobium sp. 156]UPJ96275.1 trypsin-like peptidase domain-containing protein [Bradyrhizobium sp. 172]